MIFAVRTAAINLSIALTTFLVIYKLRPRNLIVILLLSLLPLYSLLNKGVYESGDFTINVYNSMAFYKSLSEGNLIPKWAGELNATYGYPLFNFTYPLPYYVISFFHFLGLGFIASVKAAMAAFFILSGLVFYLYSRSKIATVFYLFAPYHLIDMHYRVALGELSSFIFLPLSVLFVDKKRPLLLAISLALLLLSHQAISLFFIPLLGLYCLTRKVNIKFILLSFGLALSVSSFYWLPVLAETKYTRQPQDVKSGVEFWPISSYIYSPWKLGFLWQGPNGKITYPIGYIHLPIIVLSIFLIRKNHQILFWLISFMLIFLLMQSVSRPLWQIIPLINNFQFTYRLMVIISFISAVLAGIFFSKTKISQNMQNLIIFLVIITSILAWSNRRIIPEITDAGLITAPHSESFSPAIPKWVPLDRPWMIQAPPAPAQILSGIGSITATSRTTNVHSYSVTAKTDLNIKENTLYFPGWQALPNSIQIYPDDQGIINFTLPAGQHQIKLVFSDTPIRAFSKQISLLSLLVLILLYAGSSPLRSA